MSSDIDEACQEDAQVDISDTVEGTKECQSRTHPNQLSLQPDDHKEHGPMGSQHDAATVSSPTMIHKPERTPLSRRTTKESVQRSSSFQPSTLQLLSSLMADSSSDDDSDGHSSDSKDFDLHPPALKPKPPSVEILSELLFSQGHLKTLLQNSSFLARFTSFMHRYQPEEYPLLMQYIESSKAIAAVEYANAIAANAVALLSPDDRPNAVAKLDDKFESAHNAALKSLVVNALPLYITYNLVRVVSECLENEIIGKISPTIRNLVGGLSEVFCLTDPNQDDNPIVFASQEFYRLTGYDRHQVIGHNCRFLQGARTRRESPARIKASLDRGEEISETVLNYRCNGRPFVNLLMLAPLYDDHGKVKYHIGAQVDVTGLVEGGRALESFQRFLAQRDMAYQKGQWTQSDSFEDTNIQKQEALDKLKGLGELLDGEESAAVQIASRHGSADQRLDDTGFHSGVADDINHPALGLEFNDCEVGNARSRENSTWDIGKAGPHGLSGKLPGVYEKYMLIRPAPSLRIIFASSEMKSWGKVVQNPFLSHIAAEQHTLNGLKECFQQDAPVTAKVKFMLQRSENRHGTAIDVRPTDENLKQSKPCWISATPLFGSNDRVGVWMVVFVERLKGSDRAERQGVFGRNISQPEMNEMNRRILRRQSYNRALSGDVPIKPKRLDVDDAQVSRSEAFARSPVAEQLRGDQEEKRGSMQERHRSSPSPTANQSRKASPRQQPVQVSLGSSARRLSRVRLATPSDGEESDTES